MSVSKSHPRIGYAPYSRNLDHPGDRRRFVAYARARNLPFEVVELGRDYDIVVLSELSDISVWSEYRHGKVVYDLIDSYLAVPRTNIKQLLRGFVWYANGRQKRLRLDFKGAIQNMCRRADAVVCTTIEQKSEIEPFCPNVHIVLDIHDYVIQNQKHDYRARTPFNLVWEGLPSNLPQLKALRSVLREISQRRPVVLNIVTDPDRPGVLPYLPRIKTLDVAQSIFDNVVLHRWDEATFSKVVTECDVAIIPILTDDVFTRGKPGNKLALLWRVAMPVVTSATPAYRRMQDAAGLGYLACDDDSDWLAALERLMTDETARREAGERGHAFVSANLQTNQVLALWDDVFFSIGYDFRGIAS
jgi:glycosyltransferase involved in cell wall biosynthesis